MLLYIVYGKNKSFKFHRIFKRTEILKRINFTVKELSPVDTGFATGFANRKPHWISFTLHLIAAETWINYTRSRVI